MMERIVMDTVIVNEIRKFNACPAVDGMSFSIKRGEVFVPLGPNGQGKPPK